MKTTLELPDDLVKQIKLRAVHEGKKLKDAVAELLRKGLAADSGGSATSASVDREALGHRRELTRKFVTGEWGVALAAFESEAMKDRQSADEVTRKWRK